MEYSSCRYGNECRCKDTCLFYHPGDKKPVLLTTLPSITPIYGGEDGKNFNDIRYLPHNFRIPIKHTRNPRDYNKHKPKASIKPEIVTYDNYPPLITINVLSSY